jgi:hypothetical protein
LVLEQVPVRALAQVPERVLEQAQVLERVLVRAALVNVHAELLAGQLLAGQLLAGHEAREQQTARSLRWAVAQELVQELVAVLLPVLVLVVDGLIIQSSRPALLKQASPSILVRVLTWPIPR